jgi:hypothetical protein
MQYNPHPRTILPKHTAEGHHCVVKLQHVHSPPPPRNPFIHVPDSLYRDEQNEEERKFRNTISFPLPRAAITYVQIYNVIAFPCSAA